MMRDIKFKAWHTESATMVCFNNEKLCNDEYQRLHLANLMAGKHGDVLMQFTGLQDKNGVDIYVGDVVSQKLNCLWDEGRHNLEVRFNHDQFQTGNVKSYSSLYSAVQSCDAEVIGNIHQNPELIK